MYPYNDELYHFGVKGMKWGVRRFESKSGGLTPAGKKRYSDNGVEVKKKSAKRYDESTIKSEVNRMRKEKVAPNNHPVAKAIVRNALPMMATTYISSYGMMKDKAAVKIVGDVAGWAVVANGIREAKKFKAENRQAAINQLNERK